MTTTDFTTTLQAKPVLVVWEVTQGSRTARVEVTPNGAAACTCDNYALFGECQHTAAVQNARRARGLTH